MKTIHVIEKPNKESACRAPYIPNLGADSTQRSEASHPIIKNQTNKHTPIEVAMRKLRDIVVEMAQNHTNTINRQRRNAPFLITDKPIFKEIKRKITHEALNLLLPEWIAAVKLAKNPICYVRILKMIFAS